MSLIRKNIPGEGWRTVPYSASTGLPDPWTDGGQGDVIAEVDDSSAVPLTIQGIAGQGGADYAQLLNINNADAQLIFQVDSGGEVFVGGADANAVVFSVQTAPNPTTSPVYVSLDARLVLEVTQDGGLVIFPSHHVGPAFLVKDTSGSEIIEVGEDSLGFFGQTPTAQPTGVAVDAAGIHAALVALGLITA